MLIRRHAGIAERAEENGVKFVAEHFDSAGREGHTFAQILVRAPIKLDKFQAPLGRRGHGFQYLDGLRRNLRPDAVAGNHGDSGRRAAISQRNAGQSLASSTAGFAPSEHFVQWNDLVLGGCEATDPLFFHQSGVARQHYQVPGEFYRAVITFTTMPGPTQSNRRPRAREPRRAPAPRSPFLQATECRGWSRRLATDK